MIGKIISHYKILSKLGEGGMGVVYKAHDTKLDRLVALKFLPQQLTVTAEDEARLLQEAKAISALNHPNIATIFDVDEAEGQTFLVLEYISGGTLKSKLKYLRSEDKEFPLAEALDYGIQAAAALAHAHRHQIVHRDVKTDNLMLTDEGRVKLTDFGLAKLRGGVHLTKAGTTIGTAAYMSPEQIRGEEADHRSDVFSLGVVLYELVTSRLPFRGEFETALGYSILNESPPPPSSLRVMVLPALDKVIDRCLEKEKTQRYQSVEEVVNALKEVQRQISPAPKMLKKGMKIPQLVGGAVGIVALVATAYFLWPQMPSQTSEKSIAVLPFVDISPQKDQEYFCDGMTEELINRLGNIKSLKVPARTTVFAFKGKVDDIRAIGRTLGVHSVLEGSIRKIADRLKITAQLINIDDGYQMWSETYEREMKDVFAIQADIALAIADKLRITLVGEEKASLAEHREIDPTAYDAYLTGVHFCWETTEQGSANALRYFGQALAIEPDYAPAHAGMAIAYIFASTFVGLRPPREGVPQGKLAAQKAIELDPKLADAYVARGFAKMNFDWDWGGAELDLRRALELSPRSSMAQDGYANFLVFRARFNEATAVLNEALELDPLNPGLHHDLGWAHLMSGQNDKAIPQFLRALELDPSFHPSRVLLGQCYLLTGKPTQALTEFKATLQSAPDWPWALSWLGYGYGVSGHQNEAKQVLSDLNRLATKRYVASSAQAYVCLALGQNDHALDWLEKAYEEHDVEMAFLKVSPVLAPLRNEPRFRALLKKVGLNN